MTMTTIKLKTTTLRALLRAVAPAVSKDKTRAHISCVRVMVRDGRIVADATDGHRLHRASAPWRAFEDGELAPEGVAICIPQASLAAALKAVPAPARGQAPALAVLTATGIETDSSAVRWSAVDGADFPEVDRVIPALREAASKGERETCAASWGVAPAYLVDALEACAVVLDRGGVIVQTPDDNLSPIRVHAKGYLDDGGEAEVVCVVMPMRL
jgi:DNA polymerase III sliding clamp (beta) subunit (PCNA family)